MTPYKKDMIIRKACLEDSLDLWNWRNDPQTRAMFLHQNPVELTDHQKWFTDSLNNHHRRIYIATQNGQSLGMCRFDINMTKGLAELSINLNPACRGQGYAASLLTKSIAAFYEEFDMPLEANIKKENLKSIKCFEGAGFKFVKEEANINTYFYQKPN